MERFNIEIKGFVNAPIEHLSVFFKVLPDGVSIPAVKIQNDLCLMRMRIHATIKDASNKIVRITLFSRESVHQLCIVDIPLCWIACETTIDEIFPMKWTPFGCILEREAVQVKIRIERTKNPDSHLTPFITPLYRLYSPLLISSSQNTPNYNSNKCINPLLSQQSMNSSWPKNYQ